MKKNHFLKFYLCLLTGFVISSSYAASYVSNVAGSGNWTVSGNWTPAAPAGGPGAADDVTILSGDNIILNGSKACGNLTIDFGGTFTKTSTYILNINKNLINNGTFAGGTSTGAINFNTNSKTITGTGSFTSSGVHLWVFNVNTDIASTITLSKKGNIQVNNASIVTNNGSISLTANGNTLATGSSGTWINAAGSTLQINGVIAANITLNATAINNTVIYGGTSAYAIKNPASSKYYNLTLQGTGIKSYTISPSLTIDGTVTASTTFATSTKAITLSSTAANTARIGNSTGSITGTNWTIQRYLGASTANWQDISSPINGNNLSDWDAELFMAFGATNCGDGLVAGGTFSSVYEWTPGIQDFTAISNCTEMLTSCKGFEIFLGTDLTNLNATTLTSKGTPSFGNKFATLASNASEFSLVGNPYASSIDWALVYASSTNITNYYSVYDETLNDYAVYDGASPGSSTGQLNGSGGIISASQGFWVENSAGSPTLTFMEAHKSAVNQSPVKQIPDFPSNVLKMKLHSSMSNRACETTIKIDNNGTEHYNSVTDFAFRNSPDKLTPSLTPISTDGIKTRVKTIPAQSSTDVTVEAKIPSSGAYIIDFTGAKTIFKYDCVILEDTENGTKINLANHNSYSFVQIGNSKTHKFILHFSNECDKTITPFSNTVRVYSVEEGAAINFNFEEPTSAEITISNSLGQTIAARNATASKDIITIALPKTSQVYFVRVTTSTATTTYKIFY